MDGAVLRVLRKCSRCLVPACDGVTLSSSQRRDLWGRFYTAAPRPRTPFEALRVQARLIERDALVGIGTVHRFFTWHGITLKMRPDTRSSRTVPMP